MSRKVDVSFMKQVYTDEEWQREVKEANGVLTVVDLYTNVWGPCELLAGYFQNIFFDYGDKLSLKFVRAERDKVGRSFLRVVLMLCLLWLREVDTWRYLKIAHYLHLASASTVKIFRCRRVSSRSIKAHVPLLSGRVLLAK